MTIECGAVKSWGVYPVLVLIVCLTCCHRLPRSGADTHDASADSVALEQIYAFQHRVALAENEVTTIVKNDSSRWVQHEFGWWYLYTHKSEEHIEYSSVPPDKDIVNPVHEVVYTLSGDTLLVDAVRAFAAEKSTVNADEPFAYRLMLMEMVPTDTVVMLVPWALAYGANGSEYVPPFTSIRVQLTLHTEPYRDAEQTDKESTTLINNEE